MTGARQSRRWFHGEVAQNRGGKSWLWHANEDVKSKSEKKKGGGGAVGGNRTDAVVDDNRKTAGRSCSKAPMLLLIAYGTCAIYLLPSNLISISREFNFFLLLWFGFVFTCLLLFGLSGATAAAPKSEAAVDRNRNEGADRVDSLQARLE